MNHLILVVAEKPSVALGISHILGATKKEKGYFSGNGYFVSWCVGHLVSLANPDVYGEKYKTWNIDALPIIPIQYRTVISEKTAAQFEILKGLMLRADVAEVIAATDSGREGELIFRLVYEKAACKKPFKRLWISSMEEKSIRDGFANLKPGSAYDSLYFSALCRQRADWLVGMNLTRLYSSIYRKKLPCGRVQTPTINLLVTRQKAIDEFVPETYFKLTADLGSFHVYHKAETKKDADRIMSICSGKTARIKEINKQEHRENPAALYDLTSLQRDANRLLGYSAQQTLDYTQSLYDQKLATYPRTDSRYITADMSGSTEALIHDLLSAEIFENKQGYQPEKIKISRIVNDQKVTDHHAILPTVNLFDTAIDQIPSGERNILLLLLYRLLSAVYSPHLYTSISVQVSIENEAFTATGREVLQPGFKEVDAWMKNALHIAKESQPDNTDHLLPPMQNADLFQVQSIQAEEKKTKPPQLYTEDTLLGAMETAGRTIEDETLRGVLKDSGLGTPATRAGIIEHIIQTGYVDRQGKNLIPTSTAQTFISIVSDQVKKAELTAEWEKQLAQIERGELAEAQFMERIAAYVRSVVQDTKTFLSGEASTDIFKAAEVESIGICPSCGKSVREYKKAYSCEASKEGCQFVLWKTISGKIITSTQAKKLLKSGKTDLIKGFTSKSGKPFNASLTLSSDYTIQFDFPTNNKKRE